jgi:hypothetical protein
MRNDKLIFRALVNRKSDINFQEKLTKHKLKAVYDSTINFYIANSIIKVPYVIFGSVYEKITFKNIVQEQNINIIQNYIIFFVALSFFIYFGLNYAAFTILYAVLGMLFCFGVLSCNIKSILKSQEIKNAYSDMLSAIIINILDYVVYADKNELDDKDLIQLLYDIKISKEALAKARKCGYLVSESDLSVIYNQKADIKRDLATLDDESNPRKNIRIAK